MLKEIRCDKFKSNGHPRGPIQFKKGLNIILGGGTGVNSIGKSTMLLIVDFAFGGDTYTKSDAVKQLGNHSIGFTFSFNNKDYSFVRSTEDSGHILSVDNQGKPINEYTLNEYTDWLCRKYHMDLPGLQFRNTISRFFRVYGKNNYDEFHPLQYTGHNESQEKAIRVLVALYEKYAEIEAFEQQLKKADDKITAFIKVRKYQFIPSAVDGIKKYGENVEAITDLKNKKLKLEENTMQVINEEEIKRAEENHELRTAIQDVQRTLRKKESDLHLMNLNLEQGVYPTEAEVHKLNEFFPEADIKKICEIEKFHNKIQVILAEELVEGKAQIEDEIHRIKEQLQNLQKEAESLKPSKAFSQEFLDTYTELDRKIHKLEDENEAFDTRNRLQEEKKKAADRLKNQTQSVLRSIENQINNRMTAISDTISQEQDEPPQLVIKGYNSHTFEIPRDTGTGSNFKGMLIYDLATLQNTVLPAMAHDSLLFVNISYDTVFEILRLYEREKDKQIFIAFDRADSYNEETQDIVERNVVLRLNDDKEALFGWKWSRKDNNENSVQ